MSPITQRIVRAVTVNPDVHIPRGHGRRVSAELADAIEAEIIATFPDAPAPSADANDLAAYVEATLDWRRQFGAFGAGTD